MISFKNSLNLSNLPTLNNQNFDAMQSGKNLKLLTLILLTSSFLFSQSTTMTRTEAEFQKLIKKGLKEKHNADYSHALEYFTKAESLAEKEQSKDDLFLVKNEIGIIYGYLSNFGEALGYYQQSLDLAKGLDSNEYVAKTLNNIGLLYAYEGNFASALQYFGEAYEVARKHKLPGFIESRIAVNISSIYNTENDFKKAQQFLLEVENIPTTEETKQMWKINYAESLLLEGKVTAAEEIAEQLLNDIEANCYVCITELLSKIYKKQNKKDLAILYAEKGLRHTSNFRDKIDLYNHMSQIYFDSKNYSLAFKYRDSVVIAKDSMAAKANRGLYEANKVNMKVQEYQSELKVRKERQSAERMLFIFAAIFTLVLFYFIYRTLQNRIIKQKQEKIIAENEKKILGLEFDSLQSSIAEKNRKLSAKALYLSGRNELIEGVIDSLSQIPEISKKKEVADYIRTLKTYIRKDEEWDDFITYFEEVNPVFIKTLTEKYHELNASDIRYLCYVYMNLDLREIANIFNITYNAAQKRQRRIKEKMQIDNDLPLHEYLVQKF